MCNTSVPEDGELTGAVPEQPPIARDLPKLLTKPIVFALSLNAENFEEFVFDGMDITFDQVVADVGELGGLVIKWCRFLETKIVKS